MPTRLLILDDDEQVGSFVRAVGEELGYLVTTTSAFDQFSESFYESPPDAVVLDLHLGKNDGIEVLRFLSGQGARARIVLLSGIDSRTLDSARQLGEGLGLNVGEALTKPVRAATLREALEVTAPCVTTITSSSLVTGIEQGELFLEYQPIITCGAGKLHDIEALVRWNHPTAGRVAPDQFIPVAEADPELMDRLTLEVARLAAADWPAMQGQGFAGRVAINVSAQNLRRRDLADRLANLLDQHGLPPTHVKLEVTETAAMTDPLIVLDSLLRLRLKGLSLAIDDFGTGYSSLAMLRQLPYSELKIDRSLIADIETSQDALAIVQAILAMARAMRLETVAEGVEDPAVLPQLARLGADYAQGYGIAKPLGKAELLQWMAASQDHKITRLRST